MNPERVKGWLIMHSPVVVAAALPLGAIGTVAFICDAFPHASVVFARLVSLIGFLGFVLAGSYWLNCHRLRAGLTAEALGNEIGWGMALSAVVPPLFGIAAGICGVLSWDAAGAIAVLSCVAAIPVWAAVEGGYILAERQARKKFASGEWEMTVPLPEMKGDAPKSVGGEDVPQSDAK